MIKFVVFSCLLLRPAEGQGYDFILYQGESAIVATELQHSHSACIKQCQLAMPAMKTTAIHDKTGKMCKCVHMDKHINERGCIDRCVGDERLEGSGYDKCNFIDGVCYIYNYIQTTSPPGPLPLPRGKKHRSSG